MSEKSTSYYREGVAPRAISTTELLGQVLFLVAIALGFCAVGTLIGQELELGTARLFSFAGFGMLLVSSFAGERFRVGAFAMGWLFATALAIGIGLGPVIAYFVSRRAGRADAGVRRHRGDGARRRRARIRALEGPRAVDAAAVAASCSRPAAGTIVWSLFGGTISPLISLAIYGLSAVLIVVDFNYLRKHGTENDTIWLATGIFVSIINIFVSLLNIFSSRY